MQKTTRNKCEGFTLFELIIAAAIIVIAALLAAPSFAQFIKQDRIITSSNRAHSVIKFARSEAVKRETSIFLRVVGTDWEVVENLGESDEVVINIFTQTQNSVSVNLMDLNIASTGEFDTGIDISISDTNSNTTDYRLCGLISGQTWVEQGTSQCS